MREINHKSYCHDCKREQKHVIVCSHQENWNDKEEGMWAETYFQIVKCGGCETVSFRQVGWFSEDYEADGRIIPTIKCYPQPETGALATQPFLNVPQKIRDVYGEVIEAYNRRAFILCAGGLRAILEGICSAQRIKTGPVKVKTKTGPKFFRKKDLRGKIEGLFERGFITTGHRKMLHQHRFLGNEALHELDAPAAEELALAIGIIEHTLEHIYELAGKAATWRALKERRKKRR